MERARCRGGQVSRAALIAVGSELLGEDRTDTNSLWLAGRLDSAGISVARKACVGDDPVEIGEELRLALTRAPLLVVTGGLGPTDDDRTREAVAGALGRELALDAPLRDAIRARFARRGYPMPAINERQAMVIEGARVLNNPRGSAPGQWLEADGRVVVLLPGVPREMRGLFDDAVFPEVARRFGGAPRHRRILKIAAMSESVVEEKVQPVYARWPDSEFTILSAVGEIQLRLSARGADEEAASFLDEQTRAFEAALPGRIYGRDRETLEGVVGELLRLRGKTLSVAESCTGGLLAERITAVPGSSDYFRGGIVAYSNAVKESLLGVSGEALARHGAVSEEVAREMAEGARRRLDCDYALAVTGIAGPGGGSEEKPVGTAWVALGEAGAATESRGLRLFGDREMIRSGAAASALEMLRRRLTGEPRA
jgi:nicotinamide-nucleotide amidase